MEYILFNKDDAYLMYFAIDENYRNKGYGSLILKDIIKRYNNVLLSIEEVQDEISKRRKKFYLRNVFFETGKSTSQNNVKYEVLCSSKNYNLTNDKLINLYSQITNSKIFRYLINKKFNLLDIDLINNN